MALRKRCLCLLALSLLHCIAADGTQAAKAQEPVEAAAAEKAGQQAVAGEENESTLARLVRAFTGGPVRRSLLPFRKNREFFTHDRNHRVYTTQNAYKKPPHDRTYRNFQYLLNLFQDDSPATLKDRSWTGNAGEADNGDNDNDDDATGRADYEEDDDDPLDFSNATKTTRREQGRDEDFRNDPQHAGMDETEREDARTAQGLPTHAYRGGRGLL